MPVVSTKFKVDGEADYKRALSDVAASAKVLNSEMKLAKARFDDNAESIEALTKTHDILDEKVKNQKERVAILEEALKHSTEQYGEADKRTKDWQTSLNNANTKLLEMQRELEKSETALNDYKEAAEKADKATGDMSEETSEASEQVKKWQDILRNSRSRLSDMSKDLGTTSSTMEDFAEATEDGTEKTSGLGDMINGLADKLNIQLPSGLSNAMSSMSGFMGAASLAAAGIGAVIAGIVKAEEALITMTKESADTASKIIDLSSQTNMSTESVQKWDYVLRTAGSSMEEAQGDFSSLQEKMREALDPTSSSAELFKTLGVNVQNADGSLRDVDGVMQDVVEALSEMDDKTQRNAISSELLGGTGEKLTAIYDGQRGSLEELMAKKEENGILTDEELEKLDTLNGKMGDLQDKTDTLKQKLGAEFAPYLGDAAGKASEFISKIGESFEKTGIVDSFGSILDNVTDLMVPLGELAETLMPVLKVALEGIAGAVQMITDALNVVIGTFKSFVDMLKNPLKPIMGSSSQYMDNGAKSDAYASQNQGTVNTDLLDQFLKTNDVYMNDAVRASMITNISIDAKSVKEFNDIINISKKAQVEARMFGAG